MYTLIHLHFHNATDFPHFLHFHFTFSSFSFINLSSAFLYITPSLHYDPALDIIVKMRLELLLLSILAPINSFAHRGRDLDYIPSPPLVSEEEAEDTLNSFELSARDRQAVFGDTSKLTLSPMVGR